MLKLLQTSRDNNILEFEGVADGNLYSNHYGTGFFTPKENFILFLFPRCFTPICMQEVEELQDFDVNGELLVGSTDSPETALEAFEKIQLRYPFVSIPAFEMNLWKDNLGYCLRATLIVKNRKVVYTEIVPNETKRDLARLVKTFEELTSEK